MQLFEYPSIPGSARKTGNYKLRFGRRGLGMLEVMILIAVMSSLLIAGFLQWRVRGYEISSRKEQVNLSQADAALLAFATVAHRLPCPDTNRDGLEDCGSTDQKGWLPSATLKLAGADPGVSAGQVSYLVQRGDPSIDLVGLTDGWRPMVYDGSDVSMLASNYDTTPIQTLSDFCAKVVTGSTIAFNANYANVRSATPRLVAYALAHPGSQDSDGDGDLFDGENKFSNKKQMEPSDRRSSLGVYDDIVFERSMTGVRNSLGCDVLNNSIDSAALAADVVQVVADMQKGNIKSADTAVTWAAASVFLSGMAIVATAIGIVSDAGNAVADGALCAATLGLAVNACAALGVHGTATALGGAEIALNAASMAGSLVAMAKAIKAKGVADANPTTAAPTCTAPDSSASVAQVESQITKMEAEITALQVSRTLVVTKKATADSDRSSKIALLRASLIESRPAGTTSPHDGKVDALLVFANIAALSQDKYKAALANRDSAQAAYNNANSDAQRYQNMINNRAALTVSTRSSLAQESQTLVNLRNAPGTAEQIQAQEAIVYGLQGDLQVLTETLPPGTTPSLVVMRDHQIAERDQTATVALNAANTTLAAESATFATASTGYSSAYADLKSVAATTYTLSLPGGTATASVVTGAAVSNALAALFGSGADDGQSAPHVDSVYSLPAKLQKELDGIDQQITDKNKTLVKLKENVDEMKKPVTMPPECSAPATPAKPFKPDEAKAVIVNVDKKGGIR